MDSPPVEQAMSGAQLVVRHSVYRCHGIYAGGGRMIHYEAARGSCDEPIRQNGLLTTF